MGWIFHFPVLLYRINRDEIPAFKLPWLVYDTECIGDMKAGFPATVAQSHSVTTEQAKLRGWKRLPAERMKVFSPPL